jgi:transcriptional regulator with XRE-family HTH domain
MANKYHSLKLFRLLIGDVSQARFADMIGMDSPRISRIEAGLRDGSTRIRDSIRALLHPFASVDDIEALLGGEMLVSDVQRLAEAYARVKDWKPSGPDGRDPVGGSYDGNQSQDVGGTPPVRATEKPAGDSAPGSDDAGAGVEGGTRATA